MKAELEVARDAVRAALGDELADALEWAAAAVRHRATLLSAARWAATDSEAPCPDCDDYNLHARECPTANMLHALDPEWSRAQVEAAHADAPQWAPRRLSPIAELTERMRRADRLRPGELEAVGDPARLTYSAGTAWPALPLRREALLSATLETPPPTTPHVWDGQWPVAHAASPSEVPTASVTSGVDGSDERGEFDPDGWQG